MEIDLQTSEEIKVFQETKLQELLPYLKANSPFYTDLFQKHNIDIQAIRTLEDLGKIPFTTKNDLQERNEDFICVDRSKIVDYITTSGTLGDPVTFAMTDRDLDRLAENEYRSFLCADGTTDDIYQLMTTIDRRFMAGLAYFLGVRKLGAGIVRVGSGLPELQWDTIKRIKPTAIIAVPSFILRLVSYAEKQGIDYRNSSIKKAVCIGEPLRNPDFSLNTLGRQIKEKWDIKLYSTYASTEMSTAFTECGQGKGGHQNPALIITELLAPDGKPVAEGEPGEVTITTLGVEAMPLLRFKTGDICEGHLAPCACGRKSMRLGPIIGRKQQMIKYKGTSLYPPAIYDILNQDKSIRCYVVEVSTNEIGTDEINIRLNAKDDSKQFEKKLKDKFRAKLRVAPRITFEKIEAIKTIQFPKMSRKPVMFIDLR